MAVWAAVLMGLDSCQQTDAPLAALGEFLEKLQTRGWQPKDVQAVEHCILELLTSKREQMLGRPIASERCSSFNQADSCRRAPAPENNRGRWKNSGAMQE